MELHLNVIRCVILQGRLSIFEITHCHIWKCYKISAAEKYASVIDTGTVVRGDYHYDSQPGAGFMNRRSSGTPT